ncbi:Ppx/GppA phosphatase family protein [Nesterenkonia natronophila]|uniref:Ppx/GppA family phosphatase n=1 Tax=Nesterenkonia natronophila TaxID=2174932 RepID=A0A3A4F7X2_9MICC|nr:Ppx/GppA family phosphatase [Nesterenkonia natronophila]RJN32590.1 Ppx/GppA family phosphatase [Nesterenkonia natronophila]
MRLGVLDIGSNTVHLLLVDAYIGAKPEAFASHKRPLSLVKHLDSSGAITEAGQQELIGFISEAVRFAARHRAEDMLSFCTSAIREAPNGAEVISRVQAAADVELTELTGSQESAMTFFAVRRWRGWSAGHILNFDIGGGSLELAYGQNEMPSTALSVPLGAGRLTRDFLPSTMDHGSAPDKGEVKELKAYVREEIEAARREFPQLKQQLEVTATSKTFRSLARLTGAEPSAEGPYVRRTLALKQLKPLVKQLAELSSQERAKLPGVSEMRADQVFAGALVAETAMKTFGIEELTICPWALREGLILRRLDTLAREVNVQISHAPAVGHVDLARELRRPTHKDVKAIAVEHARA